MLHPQTQALLDLMIERGVPPTHTLTPAEARSFYRERRGFTQPAPPAVALLRELQADGPRGAVPLRLYRPMDSDATSVLPAPVSVPVTKKPVSPADTWFMPKSGLFSAP